MRQRGDISHADYLRVQSSVADEKRATSARRAPTDFKAFKLKFRRFSPFFANDSRIICLGARRGTEVLALRRLGYEQAFGIDIVDYDETGELVTYGDFMDLRYPDDSFDFAYTNSLDHTLDPVRFCRGLGRVMKPGGYALLEAPHDTDGDGSWRAYWHWRPDSFDEIGALIVEGGGNLVGQAPIAKPYKGRCFLVKWKAEVTAADLAKFRVAEAELLETEARRVAAGGRPLI